MVRLQHSLVDPSTGHSKRRLLPLYVRNTQVRPSPTSSPYIGLCLSSSSPYLRLREARPSPILSPGPFCAHQVASVKAHDPTPLRLRTHSPPPILTPSTHAQLEANGTGTGTGDGVPRSRVVGTGTATDIDIVVPRYVAPAFPGSGLISSPLA